MCSPQALPLSEGLVKSLQDPSVCQGPALSCFVLHSVAHWGLVRKAVVRSRRKPAAHLPCLSTRAPQLLPYTRNAEDREMPAGQGLLLREQGS